MQNYRKQDIWQEYDKENRFKDQVMNILADEYKPTKTQSFKFYYKTVRFKMLSDAIASQLIDYTVANYASFPKVSDFHDIVNAVIPSEQRNPGQAKDIDIDNRQIENDFCMGCGRPWKEVSKYTEYHCVMCDMRVYPERGTAQKERAEFIFNNPKSSKKEKIWAKMVTGQPIQREDYTADDIIFMRWLKNYLDNQVTEEDMEEMQQFASRVEPIHENQKEFIF